MKPKIASTDREISMCFALMATLRPQLVEEEFIATIRHMQTEGYLLAYILAENEVVCAAGFKIATSLYMGKNLYVEDLITAEAFRSQGFGKIIISWMRSLAETEACGYFHLDTGVQRSKSQKFYINQGLDIVSYHFSQKLIHDR